MKTQLEQLRVALDKITLGKNDGRLVLTSPEQHSLRNIKASVRNILDDGFVGGESGVSETHITNSLKWCEKLVNRIYS